MHNPFLFLTFHSHDDSRIAPRPEASPLYYWDLNKTRELQRFQGQCPRYTASLSLLAARMISLGIEQMIHCLFKHLSPEIYISEKTLFLAWSENPQQCSNSRSFLQERYWCCVRESLTGVLGPGEGLRKWKWRDFTFDKSSLTTQHFTAVLETTPLTTPTLREHFVIVSPEGATVGSDEVGLRSLTFYSSYCYTQFIVDLNTSH